jgi:ribosome-binding protein aMBF1 (putative translation factor)
MGDPYSGLRSHVANGITTATETKQHRATGEAHGSQTQPDSVARGEKHGNVKLSDDHVRVMREMYAAGGVSLNDLADLFKVSRSQAHRIVRGESR